MRRVLFALLGVAIASPMAAAQTLPAEPGAAVLKSRCVICHEADIITSQKLSLAGWTNSINKMVRWGSPITQQEREVLLPYLAQNFAPKFQERVIVIAVSHPGPADGEATYKRACLVCHDADIIEQQTLSRAAWTRSVEKMMRWGASVRDAEKEPLVEHLAARFPPK